MVAKERMARGHHVAMAIMLQWKQWRVASFARVLLLAMISVLCDDLLLLGLMVGPLGYLNQNCRPAAAGESWAPWLAKGFS